MPQKIRQLIRELRRAGFTDRGGKGSDGNFLHPCGARVTLSGNEGDDAKRYQEGEVAAQITASQKPRTGDNS